ncbi:MAG: hypothetical protein PVF29_10135 [Desulfobacterales bacterium]|jgi:hypothetical protein
MMLHYPTDKNVLKTILTVIALLGCIELLNGCTEVVVPGAMAGGGEYYRYTTSNIAKETLMGDESEVTAAARKALTYMDMRVLSITPYTDETIILASTTELEINIRIVPVTLPNPSVVISTP